MTPHQIDDFVNKLPPICQITDSCDTWSTENELVGDDRSQYE